MKRKFKITVISTQECFYSYEDEICKNIEEYFSAVSNFIVFSLPAPNAFFPSAVRIGDVVIATIEETFNHYFSKCIFTGNNIRTPIAKIYIASFVINANEQKFTKNRYEKQNTSVRVNEENIDYEKTYLIFMPTDDLPEHVILNCTRIADIVFEKHDRTWYITKDSSNVFNQRKIIFKE